MNRLAAPLGRALGRWLSREHHVHSTSPPPSPAALAATLRPGDVLLVEGRTRVSVAVKYLTQSTWSHAALYVGNCVGECGSDLHHGFVEADIVEGVRLVGLEEFAGLHNRICRPVGLADADRARLLAYALASGDPTRAICSTLVARCFQIVKPTLEQGFDYRHLAWADEVAA